MRISDWISDVCSSDLAVAGEAGLARFECDLPPAALAELHRFGGAVEPDRQTIGPSRPAGGAGPRSEEHTSELQSPMRISYAVFCLKQKDKKESRDPIHQKQSLHTRLHSM